MQHLITVLGAVAALASPESGVAAQQTGIVTHAPVAVSTCAVTDLISSATYAEFGPPFSSRTLQLSFVNTNEIAATRVTFDVASGGAHATITDSGRFTKGAQIERFFGDLAGSGSDGPATCTVTAVTFADGSRWAAPADRTSVAARADRTFHPDYLHALTVEQMSKAWNDEWNRISPPVVTGGG